MLKKVDQDQGNISVPVEKWFLTVSIGDSFISSDLFKGNFNLMFHLHKVWRPANKDKKGPEVKQQRLSCQFLVWVKLQKHLILHFQFSSIV